MRTLSIILLIIILPSAFAADISGRIETAAVVANSIPSWQSKGTGLIRSEQNGVEWQQGFIAARFSIASNWEGKAVLNTYLDGEKHIGLTQAFVEYKPLSPNQIKFRSKIGFFYPEMSVENTAQGWLSEYTYTQSAINSWLGEELRAFGGQTSWSSSGRQRNSPWSWEANIGLFKGNDPLGTLLTWRGFAMHDRQSLHHDKVQFAPISSVININAIGSPTWLEPFTEIDGKWGVYVGAHLSYLRSSNVRYYFYDNRANPNAINNDRLYAWHTKFHSLAWQQQLNPSWRILAQWLYGSTLMGNQGVYADFNAAYVGLSYAKDSHRTTLRADYHKVSEKDNKPLDPNDSNGTGITLAWRNQVTTSFEVGAELHQHKTYVANRSLVNQARDQTQSQARLVLAWTF